VNIFTNCGDGHNTISAKAYLNQCRISDATTLYRIRQSEDSAALQKFDIHRINLNYTEALWRRRRTGKLGGFLNKYLPEFNSVYPTYRFNIISGKIHPLDHKIIDALAADLKIIVPKGALVFCPYGFGNHVDHLLVRTACERVFPQTLFYWADFPYVTNIQMSSKLPSQSEYKSCEFVDEFNLKIKLAKMYKSQYQIVIRDEESLKTPEKYYYKQTNIIFN
jgi:hypothetical protein